MAKQVNQNETPVANEVTETPAFLTLQVMDKGTFVAEAEKWGKDTLANQAVAGTLANHALLHFHRTGDTHYMNVLRKATPSMVRTKALVVWFKAFAPVKLDSKSDSIVKDKESVLPTYPDAKYRDQPENAEVIIATNALLSTAFEKPFWEYSKEGEPVTPEMDKFLFDGLTNLLKRYDAMVERVKKAGDTVPAEVTEQAQAIRDVRRNMETVLAA
jgi:hypothetical protein